MKFITKSKFSFMLHQVFDEIPYMFLVQKMNFLLNQCVNVCFVMCARVRIRHPASPKLEGAGFIGQKLRNDCNQKQQNQKK